MATKKTQPTNASVSEFLGGLKNETRRRDSRTVVELMQRTCCGRSSRKPTLTEGKDRSAERTMRSVATSPKILIPLAALLPAGGCTARQGYEFVRSAGEARAQCDRMLTAEAAAACEADYARRYETYRAERQKVLETEQGD